MPKNDPLFGMSPQKAESFVKGWLKEIDDALKREKKYRKLAKHCVELYEAKKPDETPFSILYSNTETLVPAVYNSKPIPVVQRRFKDADPNGRAVSEVSTRTLKFLLDSEDRDYDSYDDLVQAAVLDGLVTNRGLHRVRYHANEDATVECVYGESVRWDKFFHGYARTWKKVPWIGFEWDMSAAELKKNFPQAQFDDLRKAGTSGSDDDDNLSTEEKEELAGVKTYKVYELWDKTSGKVIFLSPLAPKAPLRYIDDPLGLSNFFPVPKPLNFMRKITTLVPTPLYEHYKQQAAELNTITIRLKAIIKAIKYRGAYNAAVEGIEKMLKADDNELVPVENVPSMPDGTSMDKLLWTVPVNELVQTAQVLSQAREQIKQVIYEITGISDILRGASVASETATAQNIKNQWGTLRLKKMQKEVMRYCREALVIMLEVAAGKFEQQTIAAMTGLHYLTNEQKQQAQQTLSMAQSQAATTGQQPPPVPPEITQMLQLPSWEDIMGVLRQQVILHYKVDIETNSTIDAEASQDKQDIAELLNALSQFLNGIAPLVEQGIMPIDVAKTMMLVISRRYNFGTQLEDALNQMQQPQSKGDPAADAKAQAAKQQAAVDAQKSQLELQKMQREEELARQDFENKKNLMLLQAQIDQAELDIKRQELAMQREQMGMKMELAAAQHKQKMEAAKKPKETSSASV